MIKSSTGLKAKVRNIAGGNDNVSKAYIRIFFMERFMERVSNSEYKDHFILKGGMLVASLLGINVRATMDIDTTVKALPLTQSDIERIVNEICSIELEDNVTFAITNIETIMDDFDYPGVRVHLEAYLDKLKQPMKIDVSTDDVITPDAIEYEYKLMFEDRTINLNTYNIETMLAEKSQTIINRGIANTRMRDFYDIYELLKHTTFSWDTAKDAFIATCKKRDTIFTSEKIEAELDQISQNEGLKNQWEMFRKKNFFVEDLDYVDLIAEVCSVIRKISQI